MITDAQLQLLVNNTTDVMNSLYLDALTDLQDWRKTVVDILDALGRDAIRVREGGGQEDHKMSLAVTVAKLQAMLLRERGLARKFQHQTQIREDG